MVLEKLTKKSVNEGGLCTYIQLTNDVPECRETGPN